LDEQRMSDRNDLPIVDEVVGVYARHGHDRATLEEDLAKLDYRPLVIDLAECLTEAGIAIHDCDGPGRPVGGCCLTVKSQRDDGHGGVMVSWTCADTLSDGRPDG
jgi:hypothetical protein